ncbi:type II secretion system protein GspL [Glaciimonas immobilis]|uniref:General secretion pathway protein L n=1 Tax=Glaciimonas immobilis TaxID=728004 RepID=A0A840RWS9_9BURK|nr:type II secretion system protein GspL [Glaciimonas immobilis]KAF3996613.1 general secretion pathway protein GspL [Glaciimonas immobilis]MBB5201011.1 general secretion pathway protein L [Glaciimonas immobilis]
MSILFIRVPARAMLNVQTTHKGVAALPMPDCRYALESRQGLITQHGNKQLSELSEQFAVADRVVLILAAVDVNLLRLPVPPLSDAKLKMALPNLVEEHLLVDPLDCVIVAALKRKGITDKAADSDNKRLIGVVQRDWLALLVTAVQTLGGRNLLALPGQLCLPAGDTDAAVAVVTDHGGDCEIALRTGMEEGIGWLSPEVSGRSVAQEVLDGLTAILPQRTVTLYVPDASVATYQERATVQINVEGNGGAEVYADNWPLWIAGAQELIRASSIDLMQGLTTQAAGTSFNWYRWRWPLGLATALVLVNIISLNVDWWGLRHEASDLRIGMIQSYRIAYPKETVIIDPIAQMKQKVTAAARDSGQMAPGDFIALTTTVGDILSALPQRADHGAIAALEYGDHQLLVRFKTAADTDAAEKGLRKMLEARKLTLSKPTGNALQIGSSN